jgi:hypothetical protein
MSKEIADLIFGMVKWLLLHLSDRTMARLVRVVRRLAYAFTGDEELKGVLDEVVDIFETGPPGTDIVRKMFKEAHRPFAADLVRGLMGF